MVEGPGHAYVRKQCRHCLEPACASACPVGALHKTDLGAVVYDAARCMGCRYCMMACPYGIPRYTWDAAVPYVRKCILCYSRIEQGRQPACTEACPSKATIFGDRDELLAEAHRRIAENPGQYGKKVWGEKEARRRLRAHDFEPGSLLPHRRPDLSPPRSLPEPPPPWKPCPSPSPEWWRPWPGRLDHPPAHRTRKGALP